jgi:transcription elongation factor Elf1
MVKDYSEDDDEKLTEKPHLKKYFEFECPDCNANNPWPDGFRAKDEVGCHYCGTQFEVRINDNGKFKLKGI